MAADGSDDAAATDVSPRNLLVPSSRARTADLTRRYGILVVWAVAVLTFSALRPNAFATVGNAQAILGSQAVLVILAMALLVPFAAGEFDISISGTASVSLVLLGWLNVINGWPIGFAILIALFAGAVVGLVNAFFVVGIGG